MFAALLALLNRGRFNGNARRLGALACVLLAALSALTSVGSGHKTAVRKPQPGQVAVQMTLADGGAGRGFLHPGERIDLITDSSNARVPDVDVLEVSSGTDQGVAVLGSGTGSASGTSSGSGTSIVVAIDAAEVGAVSTLMTRRVFAVTASTP